MANISAIKLPNGNTYNLVDKTSGYVTTDNKLEISSVNDGNYYPIVASNSTTAAIRQYDNTGFEYYVSNGTTGHAGSAELILGNNISVNNSGNKEGKIRLYGKYNGYADISLYTYSTSGRTITIPDASGTLALTSNIKDATLTIQKNGVNVETFSANASSNKTANIVVNEVPSGGTTGQVLAKNSGTNYDVGWITLPDNGVFRVTFTYDEQNETWSCNKTVQEINGAYEVNKSIIAVSTYPDDVGKIFYLDTIEHYYVEEEEQIYIRFIPQQYTHCNGNEATIHNLTLELGQNGWIDRVDNEAKAVTNTYGVSGSSYIITDDGERGGQICAINENSGASATIYWSAMDGDSYDGSSISFSAEHIRTNQVSPTEDYDVATKEYVDSSVSGISVPTKISDLTNDSGFITGMTILSYGSSTWQNFIDAYNANKVVYCRASSNSNPASGSQTRLAFMAYVNNATTPTEVEFQYYRSVSTHTASQQGDQVYVYKLNKTNGWSVTVREASVKVVAGTGLGGTYSNGTMTLTGPTKISDLTNDSGFITAETDPTVPSWAKQNTKPSYSASEIADNVYMDGAYGNPPYAIAMYGLGYPNKAIPVYYYTNNITDSNQVTTKGYVDNAINSVSVPTKTSDLTNDSGFISTETDPVFGASAAAGITSTNITNWNGKQDALVSGTNIKTINNQSLLGSGNISVTSSGTSVPTANEVAEFDSTAHMNSTDMTSSEIENFVEDLDVGASGLLNMFYPIGSIYQTVDDGFNPNIRWGGTWELIEEGRFLQATETSQTGGDTVSAGLPNISGNMIQRSTNYQTSNITWGGSNTLFQVIADSGTADGVTQANGAIARKNITFDASRINSIYGNSTTVQPPAIKVYMWHRTA